MYVCILSYHMLCILSYYMLEYDLVIGIHDYVMGQERRVEGFLNYEASIQKFRSHWQYGDRCNATVQPLCSHCAPLRTTENQVPPSRTQILYTYMVYHCDIIVCVRGLNYVYLMYTGYINDVNWTILQYFEDISVNIESYWSALGPLQWSWRDLFRDIRSS